MKLFLQTIMLSVLLITAANAAPSNDSTLKKTENPYFIGYWQNFENPAQTGVRLIDIPAGYNVVSIAFADMNADGNVSFSLQGPPYTQMANALETFKQDIKTLQNRGVKVLLSLGGQNGYFQINSAMQKNNFVTSLQQVITTFGFDGVDYDLEGGLSIANVSYLVDATKQIKTYFANQKKTLFFTLAPETLDVYWQVFPNGKYDALIQSGLINLVAVQLYNSGCMSGTQPGSACYSQGSEDFIVAQADSTIQTWLRNNIPNAASLYAIGLPATNAAAGGGYTDPALVKKALTCLQTQTQCQTYVPTTAYPELKNLMTWDINWDAKNGYEFVKTLGTK